MYIVHFTIYMVRLIFKVKKSILFETFFTPRSLLKETHWSIKMFQTNLIFLSRKINQTIKITQRTEKDGVKGLINFSEAVI